MFTCECGKSYKFSTGLNNHKKKCSSVVKKEDDMMMMLGVQETGIAGCGCDEDEEDDITKSTFFTFPLTQLKPTANFSKEDLEMLEKRKQERLKAIQQSRLEEKQRAAAAASKRENDHREFNSVLKGVITGVGEELSSQDNLGNEEHNASINIKYVRTSSQTKQVIEAVSAAANEYCESQGLGTNSTVGNKVNSESSAPVSFSSGGKTVFNHPPRTISIIEKDEGDEDMDESERIVTLEKMTYLVLALIQQNTKIQKENALLKVIISNIDPSTLEKLREN
jgi:hypothetical protein